MARMAHTLDSFLIHQGWSANKFLRHAEFLAHELQKLGYHLIIGRTVVYLTSSPSMKRPLLKFYVHYRGLTADYLSVTDTNGKVLRTFHHLDTPESILKFVTERCGDSNGTEL